MLVPLFVIIAVRLDITQPSPALRLVISRILKDDTCFSLHIAKRQKISFFLWFSRGSLGLAGVINYLQAIEDVIDQSPSSAQLSPGGLWPLKIILFTG